MEWILVLYFAFYTGSFQQGGGGGVEIEHIEFYTEQQCEAAGKRIMSEFTLVNGRDVYQGYNTTGTLIPHQEKYTNRKYLCIHRDNPNQDQTRK